MAVNALRTRPPGVLAVVLLTVLYGFYNAVTRLVAGSSAGLQVFMAVLVAFGVAYLLWRGQFIGWVAALVLYGLLTVDLVLRATVFGLTQVPLVGVTVVTIGYLLVARRRVYSAMPADDVGR